MMAMASKPHYNPYSKIAETALNQDFYYFFWGEVKIERG
jgi:hypothetical protein